MSDYLCNLLIPGAPKSGTSSLHSALANHPSICMSQPKEPQYFSFYSKYREGAAAHNELFKEGADYAYYGESSQSYFAHGHAIERVASKLRNPKAIIILRDPIDRLVSQYAWNYKRGTEVDSLGSAIRWRGDSVDYVFDKRIGGHREVGGYTAFSRYSVWVPLWQRAFGPENVLVLTFEDYVKFPDQTLVDCCSFLGIDCSQQLIPKHENSTATTTRVVVPFYAKLAASLSPDLIKNSAVYQNAKDKLLSVLTKCPELEIDAPLAEYVREELAADIEFHANLLRHG